MALSGTVPDPSGSPIYTPLCHEDVTFIVGVVSGSGRELHFVNFWGVDKAPLTDDVFRFLCRGAEAPVRGDAHSSKVPRPHPRHLRKVQWI